MGFPDSSVAEESTRNARDPDLIPESGRSSGEGIGYPLQYSWASLVAQLVKNLSAVQETWVRSLGGEDPLEEGMATHSSVLAWRIPWTVHGVAKGRTRLSDLRFRFQSCFSYYGCVANPPRTQQNHHLFAWAWLLGTGDSDQGTAKGGLSLLCDARGLSWKT